MNIEEIANMEHGTVIPPFTARLKYVNEFKGKSQSFKLEDDSGEIPMMYITSKPAAVVKGQTVRIEKAKAEDNEYNGKTTRRVVLFERGGVLKPAGSVSQEPTVREFKDHVKQVVNEGNGNGHKTVFGGTVGCAAKMAADILLGAREGDGIAYYKSRAFSQDLYQITSDIVRVMQTIEQGKLAPSAQEREALVAKPVDNVVEAAKELFQAEPDDWAKEAE